MRKAYINCEIFHQDGNAFLVEDGIITKVGDREDILQAAAAEDETVDLSGMFVVPGFVDSHMHLLELGYYLGGVQLIGCRSRAELAGRVAARGGEEGVKWVIGRGYDETQFADGDVDRRFLDEICPEKPVVLRRVCGHVSVLNSKAFEMLDLRPDTVCEGGIIDFENGFVKERAVDLVQSRLPQPDVEEIKDMILRAAQYCASFGITAVGSDDFISVTEDYQPVLTALEQLSYQQRLGIRITEQCEFPSPRSFAAFLDEGYTQGVGGSHFTIGPLKLVADGSLGARTAAMRAVYPGTENEKGTLLYGDEDMKMLVQMANRFNMGVIVHCIGDEALDQVLRVFEDTMYPGNPLHDGIVHCQIMHPDQTEKVIRLGLSCYFQSLFIEDDAPILRKRVSAKLAETSYPFRSLTEGCLAANGSDAPVCVPDVLRGISLAVTRQASDGSALSSSECLSIEQALESYTEKGSDILGMENSGRIREGYRADFAVLESNLLHAAPEDIPSVRVMMTVCGGKTVFER